MMKLTPLEIQQQTFNHRFRGYDRHEVVEFIELVCREYETLIRDRHGLREEVEQLRAENATLKEQQADLRQCLLAAQRTADNLVEQARKEAELILERANTAGERVRMKADEGAMRVKEDINALKRQRAQLRADLKGVLDGHHAMLDALEPSPTPIPPYPLSEELESLDLDLEPEKPLIVQ